MAMHLALPRTSSGIPLSGALAIWVKTSDAFCKRSAESSFAVPAQPNVARPTTDKNTTNFFIDLLGPFLLKSKIVYGWKGALDSLSQFCIDCGRPVVPSLVNLTTYAEKPGSWPPKLFPALVIGASHQAQSLWPVRSST